MSENNTPIDVTADESSIPPPLDVTADELRSDEPIDIPDIDLDTLPESDEDELVLKELDEDVIDVEPYEGEPFQSDSSGAIYKDGEAVQDA